jgi:glucose-6-phosphate isomerase
MNRNMKEENMDLARLSGLPIFLDANGILLFGEDIQIEETKSRTLNELTKVYKNPSACRGAHVAYWMYNGVYSTRDLPALAGARIRYELTLFPGEKVGGEYVKSHGHLHTTESISGIDYPEICEVLVGTAHFLFQTLDLVGPACSEAFYVEVKAGEKIIIPPGYDHLSINPGPGPLLFSDVIARGASGIYDRFKQAGGAAYYEIEQAGQAEFVRNPAYRSAPALDQAGIPEFPNLDLTRAKPLYTSFVENAGSNWQFLWKPELFKTFFPLIDTLFLF